MPDSHEPEYSAGDTVQITEVHKGTVCVDVYRNYYIHGEDDNIKYLDQEEWRTVKVISRMPKEGEIIKGDLAKNLPKYSVIVRTTSPGYPNLVLQKVDDDWYLIGTSGPITLHNRSEYRILHIPEV